MDGDPFVVPALINDESFANTMIDSGCLSYGLCDYKFARKHNLERVRIRPRRVSGVDGNVTDTVDEVVAVRLDLDGHREERVFMYLTRIGGYDMILGLPWISAQGAMIDARKSEMFLQSTRTTVKSIGAASDRYRSCVKAVQVSAAAFGLLSDKKRGAQGVQVFSVTIADINKALKVKARTDPKLVLPRHYHEFLDVFSKDKADELPPHRGPGVDHEIPLNKVNGEEPEVPWGPLYNMSRDELLVLRKTLTELLDKGFIRVSNSPAAAPVLFVKKPGGGLRFCVDYRALNKLSRKDRYPLPLIFETLRNLSEARWFTKLDIVAAFHKLRIKAGDEWKTAFRTRYGLFEWMVTPFGLANAPSTFQKYINWVLRDFLDEFCSAYIDDILIYSSGTLVEHQDQVRRVLGRLREAGLQVDIDKCEFEVKSTKYLGFVLEAGKGIRMDPDKVSAIKDWIAPTSVKGVRSFLGFANFYRRFIEGFSSMAQPLTDLTQKDVPFVWTAKANEAFESLKKAFLMEPNLAQFQWERRTRIETDSSGWSTGGVLMQVDDNGFWRPCAFFSKKNSPAECNYEIYDKELLAVIQCLDEWDAELRSVADFEIHTDHKNLEYFTTARKLTERQVRWSLTLSKYNCKFHYIPGKDNERADALSRRDQDLPDSEDERITYRNQCLITPNMLAQAKAVRAYPVQNRKQEVRTSRLQDLDPRGAEINGEDRGGKDSPDSDHIRDSGENVGEEHGTLPTEENRYGLVVGEVPEVLRGWEEAMANDVEYLRVRQALEEEHRIFPRDLNLKISIAECALSESGRVLYRGREWVPRHDNLRTRLIQHVHDSILTGHPGRQGTYAYLARGYYWPGISNDVRIFAKACDECFANKAWKTRRQGYLKPLEVPDRTWWEISMDFITDLPESEGSRNMIVVTDRLGKGLLADGLPDLEAETLAKWFVRYYYPHHWIPNAIVSDRGGQFVGALWGRICMKLGIKRRLSTAFSPETDGSTERMNQQVETFLRGFCNHAQDDWYNLLPIAVGTISGRESATTGVSPFFLAHGWNQNPVDFEVGPVSDRKSPVAKADNILNKLKMAREWAQAAMAMAQEKQEEATNRYRDQAVRYKVGDKVWLSLENLRTDRPSKKLDQKYAKYEVLEVKGSHNYRLNTPPGPNNVFHTRLLRPARTEGLSGQVRRDIQPPAQLVEGDLEYEVERILDEKPARGRGRRMKCLVKWKGYTKPTWEPKDAVEDTVAYLEWIRR
jgi:hypothetical protein